jgi:hypothetical protein
MQNTITLANNVVSIAAKQRPFKCSFVVQEVLEESATEVSCIVRTTLRSKMQGRLLHCTYTLEGQLIAAQTFN